MAKNFKGKAQKPPLSAADKVIYGVLAASGFLSTFLISILWEDHLYHRAYTDPAVIACVLPDNLFYVLPLCLLLFPLSAFLSAFGASSRQPIFGNKTYRVPAFSHTIKVDPLFSRSFWENLSPEKHKKLRKCTATIVVALILCLFLASLGFYPRKLLTEDHTLTTYNSFDKITHTQAVENAEMLVIRIASARGGYDLCAELIFDGASYILTPEHFEKMDRAEALQYMLQLKDFFPAEKYRLSGVDLSDPLIDFEHYTSTEAELLYQLFDLPT